MTWTGIDEVPEHLSRGWGRVVWLRAYRGNRGDVEVPSESDSSNSKTSTELWE
jgi:hypothetical protein